MGDNLSDYRHDALATAMAQAGYNLQYYIYAIALHRYLEQRVPGYNYEKKRKQMEEEEEEIRKLEAEQRGETDEEQQSEKEGQ